MSIIHPDGSRSMGAAGHEAIENLIYQLLVELGEDPDREGLQGTPDRVARAWAEFIDYDPGNVETSFTAFAGGQQTVLKVLGVWSMCEHHLLPFRMDIAVGYLASAKYLGASKFARICYKYAHRLQIQEKFIMEVAAEVIELTGSVSVAVVVEGWHTCMQSRGVQNEGSMVSSIMKGTYLGSPYLKQEFLAMALPLRKG